MESNPYWLFYCPLEPEVISARFFGKHKIGRRRSKSVYPRGEFCKEENIPPTLYIITIMWYNLIVKKETAKGKEMGE